ncbi:GABA-specific permease [Frankliniella fusca]|uniref:GABA-specific permease n=1 Tax=Frankliniella fusca TaxID=407009 RepID=A0AAE1L5C5_9NEOP|nr:GABA-specific permease [Frankliniella fusca]
MGSGDDGCTCTPRRRTMRCTCTCRHAAAAARTLPLLATAATLLLLLLLLLQAPQAASADDAAYPQQVHAHDLYVLQRVHEGATTLVILSTVVRVIPE